MIQAVSHDLRTPLATIEQALDGLESGELALTGDDRAALLETIRMEHSRLKRLVENLLDLSRLQARAAESRPELWTADELVWQALEELGGAERVAVTAPPSCRRFAWTPSRSSALSSTCSRTRCASRRRRAGPRASDGNAEGVAHPRHRSRPGNPRGRARADLRAVPSHRRPARRSRAPGSGSPSRAGSRRRTAAGCGSRSRGTGGLLRPRAAAGGAAGRGPA